MSKILLIEPYKMLQQAIGLFLFPEHEVTTKETLRDVDVDSLRNCDLLIVDAGALREVNGLGADELRVLQELKSPVIWLDEEESIQRPKKEQLAFLKKPVEKQILSSAMSNFLARDDKELRGSAGASEGQAGHGKLSENEGKKESPGQDQEDLIELIDVVDEPAEQKDTAQELKKQQ